MTLFVVTGICFVFAQDELAKFSWLTLAVNFQCEFVAGAEYL